MIRRILASLLLLASVPATIASAAANQSASNNSSSNISIRPFLQNLTIDQTEAFKQFDLTIINNSTYSQDFSLSAVNFGSLNETGGVVFEGANSNELINTYGLAEWIALSKDSLQLQPNSQTSVTVTINNTSDLKPGAHYAAIIVSASPASGQATQLKIQPKVSSLIFATKLGGEKYDMHLVSITHNGNLFKAPSQSNLHFKSSGNTFVIPRGVVDLSTKGKMIAKGVINQQSSIILPQTTRSFDVPLNNVSVSKSGFLYTKYKLQVQYRYDGLDRFATKYQEITVLNVRNFVIMFLILSLLGGLLMLKPVNSMLKITKNLMHRRLKK